MITESEKARGVRVGYTVQSPGWPDVLRLLDDLVKEQISAVSKFAGWDKDQKCDLMTRQQTAIQMQEEFLQRIHNFLLAGSLLPENNTFETLADEVKSRFENETRIPGTYEKVT